MSRKATIIDRVDDIFDDCWDVREKRETRHGWPVMIGWPSDRPRGKGFGGPQVIVTAQLAAHLKERRVVKEVDLPLGRTAIMRLRRLLRINFSDDTTAWWDEREGDLMRLTNDEFAAKYGKSAGVVATQRVMRFGPRLRCAGWWREPEIVAALKTMPTAQLCEHLDIAPQTARRLRSTVNKEGL